MKPSKSERSETPVEGVAALHEVNGSFLWQPAPVIVVISGPSGAGKDSVINEVRKVDGSIHFVVTATSRPRRSNEEDGRDYHFFSREEFEEAVDDALDSLPDQIAEAIAHANVAILIEEEPDPQTHGMELLGLYEGIPLDQRSVFQGFAEPDRILIFRGPLQRLARDRQHLVEEIAVTVLHEVGHLFGISDQRLHELGWG